MIDYAISIRPQPILSRVESLDFLLHGFSEKHVIVYIPLGTRSCRTSPYLQPLPTVSSSIATHNRMLQVPPQCLPTLDASWSELFSALRRRRNRQDLSQAVGAIEGSKPPPSTPLVAMQPNLSCQSSPMFANRRRNASYQIVPVPGSINLETRHCDDLASHLLLHERQ